MRKKLFAIFIVTILFIIPFALADSGEEESSGLFKTISDFFNKLFGKSTGYIVIVETPEEDPLILDKTIPKVEEIETSLEILENETNETQEVQESPYKNFEVFNYTEGSKNVFLIHNANLNNELVEPINLIVLENANDEGYEELRGFFNKNGINTMVVLSEDIEVGTYIRRSLGISVMVKNSRGARLSGQSVSNS